MAALFVLAGAIVWAQLIAVDWAHLARGTVTLAACCLLALLPLLSPPRRTTLALSWLASAVFGMAEFALPLLHSTSAIWPFLTRVLCDRLLLGAEFGAASFAVLGLVALWWRREATSSVPEPTRLLGRCLLWFAFLTAVGFHTPWITRAESLLASAFAVGGAVLVVVWSRTDGLAWSAALVRSIAKVAPALLMILLGLSLDAGAFGNWLDVRSRHPDVIPILLLAWLCVMVAGVAWHFVKRWVVGERSVERRHLPVDLLVLPVYLLLAQYRPVMAPVICCTAPWLGWIVGRRISVGIRSNRRRSPWRTVAANVIPFAAAASALSAFIVLPKVLFDPGLVIVFLASWIAYPNADDSRASTFPTQHERAIDWRLRSVLHVALLVFLCSPVSPPPVLGDLAGAARATAIEDELQTLAPADSHFFGEFTLGHATLQMAPSAGFLLSSSDCLGVWVRAFGRVRHSDHSIELIPADPKHFPISTVVEPSAGSSEGLLRRRTHSFGFEYWLGF